jgi:tellurite resistance protein TerC
MSPSGLLPSSAPVLTLALASDGPHPLHRLARLSSPSWWMLFAALVVIMLVLDLGVFHRRAHVVRFREAAVWSAVWMALALSFNAVIFRGMGADHGLAFFQAWLIEKALSVDNIFVFLAIFSYFKVEAKVQHRVLFWGILGAVVTRGVFIWAGAAILATFHWVMYLFGGFLVLTAARLLLGKEDEIEVGHNPVIRLFRQLVPMTSEYRDTHFFVREGGRLLATPLMMVLVVIEASDVVFAVDSIPAVFGVTRDVFIVYTSNILAILGLRALSFLVASVLHRLRFLKVGLALVLAFIGAKMLLGGHVEISEWVSLIVVVGLLCGSALASLAFPARPTTTCDPTPTPPAAEARGLD